MTKYIVTRTSEWGNKQPCEEAKQESLIIHTWCTCKTLEESKKQEWFWRDGTFNHIKIQGKEGVRHSQICLRWTVEIDDLQAFIEKYGECVVALSNSDDIPLSIEIYDNYRE